MERTYEIISNELYEAKIHAHNVLINLPLDLNHIQFEQIMEIEYSKVRKLARESRLLQIPVLKEIPAYGIVLDIEPFVIACKNGAFDDKNGYAKYAKNEQVSDITISCSDALSGQYRKDFPQIIWFNK